MAPTFGTSWGDRHPGSSNQDWIAQKGGHFIPAVCGTLSDGAHMGGGLNGQDAYTGRIIPVAPIPFDTTQVTSAANRSAPRSGDPSHPLAAHAPAIAFHNRQDPDVSGEVTHPIGRMDNGLGLGMKVRRLTPLECERLQGFPDDYTAITVRGKPAADGPRYRALGNSMAVNCMRWIGERIQQSVERNAA